MHPQEYQYTVAFRFERISIKEIWISEGVKPNPSQSLHFDFKTKISIGIHVTIKSLTCRRNFHRMPKHPALKLVSTEITLAPARAQ